MSAPAHRIADVFDFVLPPQPYPGLRPFAKEEWPIFFGRERMLDEVIDRLIGQCLFVVHGDSGCGKSSLIRAGVLPRLEQQFARGGAGWATCATIPGDAPLENLAAAIAGITGADDEVRRHEIRRILHSGEHGAAPLAQYVAARRDEHVCILIDQFEEPKHAKAPYRIFCTILVESESQKPIVLGKGTIVAAHTPDQGVDDNLGSPLMPNPSYDFRLRFIVEFRPPGEAERTAIWERLHATMCCWRFPTRAKATSC